MKCEIGCKFAHSWSSENMYLLYK